MTDEHGIGNGFISAQEVMGHCKDLQIRSAVAARQHALTPPFQFAGQQQEGTKDRLNGKRVLVYGAGDVWYKFLLAPLMHLGVNPKDITIIEKERPKEDLGWQYKGVNIVTCDELAASPDLIIKGQFDFGIVATPPGAHAKCAKEAIEKFGLPVLIEKPLFTSTSEYDQFAAFCKEKNGHVVAVDWQRELSTLLYAAMGQKVPFDDSLEFSDRTKFETLAGEKIKSVSARFIEGRGNPLAAITHRKHLLNASLTEGSWASGGMLADMGVHPINALTGGGFALEKITKAFFGGATDEHGDSEVLPRVRDKANVAEMFAYVDAAMSYNGQGNIPVHIECGKGPAPNINDGRTIIEFESGKKLVHEFGHRMNSVTLYDDKGKEIATGRDRGEPYERMILEAEHLFAKMPKDKPLMAFGPEGREGIRLIEEAHRHACDHPPVERKMRQSALNEQGVEIDVGEKAKGFRAVSIGEGEYKIISPEEVIKGSCQRHATSESAIFDKQSGAFFYVDIEHGLLTRCDTKTDQRTSWKLTGSELDEDGRPKQMLSVAAVNKDGSVLVMLSEGGANAGLNYFSPETGELTNIGKIPSWEKTHPDNRPNDATTMEIAGKNYLVYGTMSRHWDKDFDAASAFNRTGAYYLLDPVTLESRQLSFEGSHCPTPLITNGLADGGTLPDGKKILFWAETVEDPGRKGADLNVYRGVLDPNTLKVSNITVFKNHQELGGIMNGVETFGRPDGAHMVRYQGKDAYGISMLELGQIRFFDADSTSADFGKEVLRIQLPSGLTRNTRFAIGTDKSGKPVGLATSQDSGHFSRRWNVGVQDKAKDGLNGSVIAFQLPEGLEAHPQAIERVDYPELARARQLADVPTTVALNGGHKVIPYEQRALSA